MPLLWWGRMRTDSIFAIRITPLPLRRTRRLAVGTTRNLDPVGWQASGIGRTTQHNKLAGSRVNTANGAEERQPPFLGHLCPFRARHAPVLLLAPSGACRRTRRPCHSKTPRKRADVGPTSTTSAQHYPSAGWMFVFWLASRTVLLVNQSCLVWEPSVFW